MRFARGKRAWGMCTRCGARDYLNRLVMDGQKPGLLVHPSCRDIKHPQEKPFRVEEGIALKRPSPNLEDDSGGAGGDLAPTLWPNPVVDPYFGGGT